ncbi:homeobox protein 21 [Actinidia rufa]|uniref:Homeobox protein 21 n=1 Tax=Actinidia rufa TaxID=165716 RepID=A0A7J0EGB7_9ERIC|nr:homeobox protein 21 [Actinidia rufa]
METNSGDVRGETVVRYRECQHNYAARVMRYTFDGCGDFLPRGEPGTSKFMLCGVCGCHRNFHRREEMYLPRSSHQTSRVQLFNRPTTTAFPPPQSHNVKHARVGNPPTLESPLTAPLDHEEAKEIGMKRKRRTNFTQAQKDRMRVFSEKLGWKLKGHGKEIHQFCEDIGITRQILKVWINNNKRLMRHGQQSSTHQV